MNNGKSIALGCIAILGIAVMPVHHNTGRTPSNMCSGWAREIHAKKDDARMHMLGCDDASGKWKPVNTRCMGIAYRVSRHEFDAAKIGRQGCVLKEDGTWSEE